jgi:hypothetical protein
MTQDHKQEKYLFFLLNVALFSYLFYLLLISTVPFDSGDGVMHFIISRFSWKHPELFLDLWGKPIFTLISSSFSQFGWLGMKSFQLVCALFTAYFCFRIAQKLELSFAWIIPVLIFFSPIYLAVLNSGLTEPFFGCILTLSIWMCFEKKYFVSAITASLLPFIRPEAYVVLPLIGFVLLIRKQFYPLLLLSLGTMVYSIIGFFYYNDALWLIHQNQSFFGNNYPGEKREFFHYIKHYKDIVGKPLGILILLGFTSILSAIYKYLKGRSPVKLTENIVLVYGSFFTCLGLHTILAWYPDVLNNLGMMRYMVTLIPATAIIALQGINFIFSLPFKKTILRNTIITVIFCILIIQNATEHWYFPFKRDVEQDVIKATGEWINTSFLSRKKIAYMHPYLPMIMSIDPFDHDNTLLFWGLDTNNIALLPDSTLLVWDSHYSPQEGKIPLDRLMTDTNLVPLKHFKYYLNEPAFETWVFLKKPLDKISRPLTIPIELVCEYGTINRSKLLYSDLFDFDTKILSDTTLLSHERYVSGNTSIKYSPKNEYGPVYTKDISDINNFASFKLIHVEFSFFQMDSMKDVIGIIEIKKGEKSVSWYGENINPSESSNNWNKYTIKKIFTENEIKKGHKLYFYFWNKGKRNFFIDNLRFSYYDLN